MNTGIPIGLQDTLHRSVPSEPAPAGAMTVAELARAARVTPHVVRHYVRIGLLKPARNADNGYKLFNQADLRRLRFIRGAKHLGYTLADIRDILEDAARGDSPCPRVRRVIRKRIDENRRRVHELSALLGRMEQALAAWDLLPDGQPDGHSVCHLIESMVDDPMERETD